MFAQVDAKTKKARPAAAAAAASLAAGMTDELNDFARRVEIVAMLLDLNDEATTLDPSVKKLLPSDARLYGGLGGLEGNVRSGMLRKATDSINHQRKKLKDAREARAHASAGATAAGATAASTDNVLCRRRRRRSQDCPEEWTKPPQQRRVCKQSRPSRARGYAKSWSIRRAATSASRCFSLRSTVFPPLSALIARFG